MGIVIYAPALALSAGKEIEKLLKFKLCARNTGTKN